MKTVDLNRFSNSQYHPGSKLKQALWYVVSTIFFQTYLLPSSGLKSVLLRVFGARIGMGLVIKPNVQIKYPWFLSVGDHVWIGEKVWIDNLVAVEIGDHVCISQGAMLLTGNHNYRKETFDLMTGEIRLETGVWIGAQSLVCPGVVCRSHAVLSVMSVASSDLEPFTIYTGNPATAVKQRIIE